MIKFLKTAKEHTSLSKPANKFWSSMKQINTIPCILKLWPKWEILKEEGDIWARKLTWRRLTKIALRACEETLGRALYNQGPLLVATQYMNADLPSTSCNSFYSSGNIHISKVNPTILRDFVIPAWSPFTGKFAFKLNEWNPPCWSEFRESRTLIILNF